MDKMDSYKFGVKLENYSSDDSELDFNEIEDIKNIKKMKELLGNYQFIVNAQQNIINKGIINKSKERISAENLASRYSILDKTGLEKAKSFLQKQREMIKKCNEEYEGAKKMIYETNQKIDEERNYIVQRRSQMEYLTNEGSKSKEGAMELENQKVGDEDGESFFDEL